mgnify:FL=1
MIHVNRTLWTLLPALVFSGFGPVQAAGTSYQWVDATGKVIYGDSPPSVTYTRRVGDHSSPGLLRDLPPSALESSAASATPAMAATHDTPRPLAHTPGSSDQIDQVLAKLNAALAQVEALTADKLEAKAVAPATSAAEPVRETPIAETASGGKLAAAAQSLLGSSTTVTPPLQSDEVRVAPASGAAVIVPPPVAAKAPSRSGVSVAIAQPVEVVLDSDVIDAPELVAEAAHVPAVLGTVPPMEVAVSSPQPIESRMSPKDRARARWRRENMGEMRFLKRLATPTSLETN